LTATTVEVGQPAARSTGRPHLDHVDAVRPVKQLGVVSTHTITTFAPGASLLAGGALTLLYVSREAFLFVSACMLTYANPDLARISWRRFIHRRALTIALPYACWTLIYWASLTSFPLSTPRHELDRFLELLQVGYWQLYYLVVIAQFYALFPFVLLLLRATRRHPVRLLAASFGLQLLLTGLLHWNALPWWMESWWATREVTTYQFYLIGGCLVATHLRAFEQWLGDHARTVVAATFVMAGVAEGWYLLDARHVLSWLGAANDPLQPITVPFNIGAILCLYLLGQVLVDARRSVTFRRWVRRGSDNSYGIFLCHTLVIGVLVDVGWGRLTALVPWPIVIVGTVLVIYCSAWALTVLLARTPLSTALTGRNRIRAGAAVVPVGASGR
jgi:peptidoglycan/LPS O-acetylase OafA/YrhL